MVIFTNGLWTKSRTVSDGDVLRKAVQSFLYVIKNNLR